MLGVVLLLWGGAVIFLTSQYIQQHVLGMFPDSSSVNVQILETVLAGQSVLLLISLLALLVLLIWIFSHYVVKPLRNIVASLEAFTSHNERLDFAALQDAPTEIRKLADVLTNFANGVEQAHARDLEVSRVKSDFISTAAHQFRTPLTGIRWALEALEKEPLTPDQKALVTSATEKSHQLVNIVGTLLDISSIESGKYKYLFVSTDLMRTTQDVVRDFMELAGRSQVSLNFVPPQIPIAPVRADQERIKWVLNNIVENAIRYTPVGGSVRVSLEMSGSRVYVHVRDTGIGIQSGDKSNIFERFYRAQNAVAKENAGNGLGLYIARTIATDHGGDLNFATNTDGPGTTFSLSLPLAAAAA